MNAFTGQPISRVDGPEKVTGQAIYAAEFRLTNLAYAALADQHAGAWLDHRHRHVARRADAGRYAR